VFFQKKRKKLKTHLGSHRDPKCAFNFLRKLVNK